MHEKKYTKIQRHPAGFATTKKIKIQKHPAGFAATQKKQKHPKGLALQKYTPRGLYCHYHTINENKSTPQGLHLQKCRSTPQGLQLQKYTQGVCITEEHLPVQWPLSGVCINKNAEAPRRVCNCKNTPQGVCITEEHLSVPWPLTGVPPGRFKSAPIIAIWRQILKIRRSRLRSGRSGRQGRSVKLAHRLHSVAVSRCYHFPFFAG